jgi:hypothetical protein
VGGVAGPRARGHCDAGREGVFEHPDHDVSPKATATTRRSRGRARPTATRALAVAVVAWTGGSAAPALASDIFEIQVYDGTANAPGVFGLELHVNDALDGVKTLPPPELPPNHLLHLTLEPSFGVTPFWEIGAYVQTAVRPVGGYDFAGAKLRSKFVTPPGWEPHLRFGLNLEAGYLFARYEPERWGAEMRPIVAWENDRWLFAANPIVGISLTGGAPTFEPAAMAVVKLAGVMSVGLEYYGDLGPIVTSGAREPTQHTLFEVINLLSVPNLEVNAGLGEGLDAASSRLVAKVILGYSFEGRR